MQTASLKNILGRDTHPQFLKHLQNVMAVSRFDEISFTQRKMGNDGNPLYVHKRFFKEASPASEYGPTYPDNENLRNVFEKSDCEITKYGYPISKIPIPGIGYDFSIMLTDDIVLSGDNYGEARDVSLSIHVIEAIVSFLSNLINTDVLAGKLSIDELTGVYNKRRWLYETFESGHLFVLDVDHFKTVNDTYGHDVGDVVLKTIASTLKALLRDNDSVYRFG